MELGESDKVKALNETNQALQKDDKTDVTASYTVKLPCDCEDNLVDWKGDPTPLPIFKKIPVTKAPERPHIVMVVNLMVKRSLGYDAAAKTSSPDAGFD